MTIRYFKKLSYCIDIGHPYAYIKDPCVTDGFLCNCQKIIIGNVYLKITCENSLKMSVSIIFHRNEILFYHDKALWNMIGIAFELSGSCNANFMNKRLYIFFQKISKRNIL